MKLNTKLSSKILLKFIKCRLITCPLYFLITLSLVGDKRLCHYCNLHSKGLICLCILLMFTTQWTTDY